jgi:hypothetical protein
MADRLNPNEGLNLDDSIWSMDGRFRLTMQRDGNLVLYREVDRYPLWQSGTAGQVATYAIMQTDGNFVVYGPQGALWASGTVGYPGAYLVVQTDGNMVIYQGQQSLWATNTY